MNKGFTLIELLIVVVIAGILGTIGTLAFKDIAVKNAIESDTKHMLATVQYARSVAFHEKRSVAIDMDTTKRLRVLDVDTGDEITIDDTLRTEFDDSNTMVINAQGFITTTGNFHSIDTNGTKPVVDCVLLRTGDITLGKWDGGVCNEK